MANATSHPLPIDVPIADLVPHAAPMVLLEKITSATSDTLSAEVTIDQSSPFYAGEDELPAWWSVEYLAQGVATLAGLREHAKGGSVPVGFLTGCRNFLCSRPGIPFGTKVIVSVSEVMALDESVAVFDARMDGDNFTAESRITVYSPGDL